MTASGCDECLKCDGAGWLSDQDKYGSTCCKGRCSHYMYRCPSCDESGEVEKMTEKLSGCICDDGHGHTLPYACFTLDQAKKHICANEGHIFYGAKQTEPGQLGWKFRGHIAWDSPVAPTTLSCRRCDTHEVLLVQTMDRDDAFAEIDKWNLRRKKCKSEKS